MNKCFDENSKLLILSCSSLFNIVQKLDRSTDITDLTEEIEEFLKKIDDLKEFSYKTQE